MKILTETDVIRIIKEEWDSKLSRLMEDSLPVAVASSKKGDKKKPEKKIVISKGLMLKNSKGEEFEVVSVDMNAKGCTLSPGPVGGPDFWVDAAKLEKEYELN